MRNVLGGWELAGITQATSGHSLIISQNVTENTTLVAGGKTYGAGSIYGLNTGIYTPLMSGSACNAGMERTSREPKSN